ncbi:MAG TPA: hypothetical protein VG777_08320 [Thermoanaerobaculia bacterium]|nr:hypothetical protein [Thermoanaerobaculia bacterium]
MRASLATIEVPVARPVSRGSIIALAASLAILAAELLGIVHGLGLIFGR